MSHKGLEKAVKIVFVSNYFNHHQSPLSEALDIQTDHNYSFLAAEKMAPERRKLGWEDQVLPAFVCNANDPRSLMHIQEADVLIAGSFPEQPLRSYIRKGKLLFRYAERPLKHGIELPKYLPRLLKWHWRNPPGKPIYMLCASAFTAGDYRKFGLFRDRCYKWGYFPETRLYPDLGKLFANKSTLTIVWCGRFLDLKHPDDALEVARHLKADGMRFALKLIGTGPLEDALRQRVQADELQDCVELLDAMSPEKVRDAMEQAGIFLFTSDRKEGWGAVLNEAMNSGCAVAASEAVGSVPDLGKDG